jgi:hypothetical protein
MTEWIVRRTNKSDFDPGVTAHYFVKERAGSSGEWSRQKRGAKRFTVLAEAHRVKWNAVLHCTDPIAVLKLVPAKHSYAKLANELETVSAKLVAILPAENYEKANLSAVLVALAEARAIALRVRNMNDAKASPSPKVPLVIDERQRALLGRLLAAWSRCSDTRLGQLLSLSNACPTPAGYCTLYEIYDDQLIDLVECYARKREKSDSHRCEASSRTAGAEIPNKS